MKKTLTYIKPTKPTDVTIAPFALACDALRRSSIDRKGLPLRLVNDGDSATLMRAGDFEPLGEIKQNGEGIYEFAPYYPHLESELVTAWKQAVLDLARQILAEELQHG